MNEWISVKERLPEIDEQVLTYEEGYPRLPIKTNYILNNYLNTFAYGNMNKITHWMPLPNPPEDKNV